MTLPADSERIGLLLVNLGTPDAPTPAAVRRYLKEFLWDKRVVEAPRLPWWLLLNGIILNTRPKKSAAKYQKIWTQDGSPLLVISTALKDQLQTVLGAGYQVELGMRYGNPSIKEALEKLRASGCNKLLVAPLFPQYSGSTTGSVFDAVTHELRGWRALPELRLLNQYHQDDGYIQALADSVRTHWQEKGRAQLLLMSFHGLPQDYADKGDPYPVQCRQTGELLAQALGLSQDQWLLSFQSRLGPKQWLKPYTEQSLRDLAARDIKNVQVICPGFAVDCLETLEEIADDNREVFMAAGGEDYGYIPCLNDSPAQVSLLAGLIRRYTQGWK